MRNGHASVTHNVTCESQPPVPSRPYPARPALYIERGDFSIHLTLGDVALALGQQVIARFHKDGRHRAPNGNYHHATKITDEQVREVRERYTRAWGEVTKLAAEYGISQNQMSWILQGKRRPEAGGPIHPPRMVRKSKSPGMRGQR